MGERSDLLTCGASTAWVQVFLDRVLAEQRLRQSQRESVLAHALRPDKQEATPQTSTSKSEPKALYNLVVSLDALPCHDVAGLSRW